MGIIDKIIWCGIGIIVVAIIVFALWMCFCIARREDEIAEKRWKEYNERGDSMSDRSRTREEYIKRHADQYQNGDTERAKEDAIVKEVLPTLEME